jgi:type IV secretion system protein VirB6
VTETVATTIFQSIGGTIDNVTQTFVTQVSADVITMITPWAISGVSLFVTFYGYMIIVGKIQEPFYDFLIKCVKIILISSFALNASNYLEWIVGTFQGFEASLMSAINGGHYTNFYQTLDHSLGKGMALVNGCFQQASNTSVWEIGTLIRWCCVALSLLFSFALIVVMGGIIIIMTSVLLKILFAIGPLFILCLLWPLTARFFDQWFSQTMTYLFKIALASLVISLAVTIFDTLVSKLNFNQSNEQSALLVSFELLVGCGILYAVVKSVVQIAGQLGSGLATGVMGVAQLASAAATPLRMASSIGRTAQNALDPVRTRRDMQSGMMSTARRSNHLVAGNTILNPAYRQALRENLGKYWGKSKGGTVREG